MNPHSSVNLLKQVSKLKVQEMEYTLRKTNFRNHKKTYLGYERTKSAKFALRPMYLYLEVNKIRQSFYLGRHAQQKFA